MSIKVGSLDKRNNTIEITCIDETGILYTDLDIEEVVKLIEDLTAAADKLDTLDS